MTKEGLERAWERPWDRILLDLVLEDMTPAEAVLALKVNPLSDTVPLVVVGSPAEIHELPLSPNDLRIVRPFEWEELISAVFAYANSVNRE